MPARDDASSNRRERRERRERHQIGPVLGSWIRATRMEQGISQRALAERSNLSRSYLCDIERGRGAQPSVATIDKLAGALGASRADLMRAAGLIDTPAMPRESSTERQLLAVFRDLSESGQSTVLRFVRFLHTEEHRWVQSPLPGEPADVVVEHVHGFDSARGPALFEFDRVDQRGPTDGPGGNVGGTTYVGEG